MITSSLQQTSNVDIFPVGQMHVHQLTSFYFTYCVVPVKKLCEKSETDFAAICNIRVPIVQVYTGPCTASTGGLDIKPAKRTGAWIIRS